MKRVIPFLLVFLTAGVAGAAKTASSSSDVACVSDEAKSTINSCPNGPQSMTAHGKAPTVNFHSKLDEKRGVKENKPTNPSEQFQSSRDDRSTRLKQRALALLVEEIQRLEQLFQATDDRAKDRVILLRRLAEDYVELESAAFREKTQAEIDRDDAKKKGNATLAGQKQATVNSRNQTLLGSRKKAIAYYTTLVNEYAGKKSQRFAQNPPPAYPQLDEVYYYLAYEYEQASDYANARRVYLDLITNTPNSKYITNAYLAFGELFFNEAQGDPSKWRPAREAYEKVIAKPPPDNKVYGYAWYKLAYVFWNVGDFPHALDAFKKTIDYGTQYPQLPNAGKLAEAARRDLIPVYALSGSPTEAHNFFKPLSGDTAGSSTKTFKMMDDLGNNYIDTGHYPEAIALYKDLLVRDHNGDKTCGYQSHITEATMAMKSGDKTVIVRELDNQLKRYSAFKAENHSAEGKQECANRTAALLTETAMAWHVETVGSNGQRGTGDKKTMALATALYKKVADTWNAEEFSKFTFPRLVKEDWPTIYRIKYNMADLAYFNEDWAACGPAFGSVVMENPNAPEAAEAAYAEVLCYQNIYLGQHQKGADRKGSGNLPGVGKNIKEDDEAKYKSKDMTDSQKSMVQAFNRYVCYIKPAANDQEGQKQLVEVKYARARTYFEAQRWEEAALAFRDIAMNHADTDLGIFAAQLYLESINVLTWHGPKRASCVDDMIADVPKFIELYCAGAKGQANAETCTTLAKVQCDIQRYRAELMVKEADKGGANSVELYQKAGQAYFDLWEKYGATPIRNNQAPQCEKLDEILYNSGESFQSGRLIASAIRARRVLLDPTYKMEQSDLARKAMYKIGGNYQAIAVYDQAADWFEKYAKQFKNGENADTALSDAIILRLGLGHENEAIADAKTFREQFGARSPQKAAQVAFAVGAHYAEKEDYDKAKSTLQGAMGLIDKGAPDIQMQAHATLARALERTKLHPQAKGEYGKVRQIWGSTGQGVVDKINQAYKDEDPAQRERRVGRALDAVGEALFAAAEEKKKDVVDPLKFPVYSGAGNRQDVAKYNETKLKPWLLKKKAAIESVDKEFQKVTELQPIPPPKWVIAAASRAGLMWGDFFDEFGRAPTPKEWNQFPEVKAEYLMHLDEARMPLKNDKAKPALKKCLDSSVKFQYFDQHSRDCEAWLAKNYKTEYHIVDELRGAPTLSNSGLDDRPPPLNLGGTLWHPVEKGQATEKAEIVSSENDNNGKAGNKPAAKAQPKKGAPPPRPKKR